MKKWIQGGLLIALLGTAVLPLSPNSVSVAQEPAESQSAEKMRADQLLGLGAEQGKRGQFREAKAAWEEALNLYRQIGDQKGMAQSLSNLGAAYSALGEYVQAIDYHQQSLVIRRQIGDQKDVAYSISNLGAVYRYQGDYAQATNKFQQSLKIFQKIGDQRGVANSLNNFGNVYHSLGDDAQAIDYYQQSLKIFQKIGDQRGVGSSLLGLGLAYGSLGDNVQAINYHQESMKIMRKIGGQQEIAASLNNLGESYDSQGNYAQAIEYYQKSLGLLRKVGYRNGIAEVFNNLGNAYNALNKYSQAIENHEQSLKIYRKIGDQNGIANTLSDLGGAYRHQEQYDQSQTHLEDSIQVWEGLHRNLSVPQQIAFFDTQANSYSDLQAVLVAQKQPLEALVVAEQGRTRALNQQLSRANAPFDLKQIKQVAKDQNATIVEYTLVRNDLLYAWVIHPDGTIHHQPIDGKQLGQSLVDFEQQTRQWLENIRGVKDPNQDQAIPQLLAKANLKDESSPSASKEQTNYTYLRRLHTLLIDPIEDYLPQDPDERVIIIPHRSLFFVPFPALIDQDSTYLVDKHIISTAPSIQALKHLQDHQNQKPNRQYRPQKALIIGNPTSSSDCLDPLPGAQAEANKIAKWFKKPELALGAKATETLVRENLLGADIIHIAAHGKFNPVEPLKQLSAMDEPTAKRCKGEIPSGGSIILAKDNENDGYLKTHELREMAKDKRLQAEMVVLSACETGLGKVTGDGIVGLSRSLLASGVPTVVVSLWSVSDHSTTMLMDQFYTNIYEKEWDKAKSLTMAMRTTKLKHTDPGKWAAFTLIGLPD